jgi:alkylation response protein AidB-like acyl-CoA dehydrogenase
MLMPKPEREFAPTDDLPWQAAPNTIGIQEKIVSLDPDTGDLTRFQRHRRCGRTAYHRDRRPSHEVTTMEFQFAPEENAFRTQLRTFLAEELPPERQFGDLESPKRDDEFGFAFTRRCAQRGWLVPHWPKEYGGLGATYMQQLIFNEEMAYHRAPLTGSGNGTSLIGPILMLYGTDEQKTEYLPAIARAETCWAQGFSEPGSGSDLASLQTGATLEGDEFVINGGKIWTSSAQYASMAFVPAVPTPKRRNTVASASSSSKCRSRVTSCDR